MKLLAILVPAALLVTACGSDNSTGNAGGSAGGGQGGSSGPDASSGGQAGTGGSATGSGGGSAGTGGATGSGGGATGSGGAIGAGGATGSGGATGTGGAAGRDGGVTEGGSGGVTIREGGVDAPADVIAVRDAALMTNGAYVRTGWTGAYTCTGTCLAGNGNSPQDTPASAFDGNYQTRWSTNRFQQDFVNAMPTQFPLFFTVDMKQVVNVARISTHPGCADIFDAPGQVDVLVSLDGTTFVPVVTAHRPTVPPNGELCPPAANAVATDTVTFPAAVPARFIQIKATQSLDTAHPGSADRYWAIGEFYAYP